MITEVLLVLQLYVTLFFIWWRFELLIKAVTDVVNIFNNDDFLQDTVDTPKEGTEQHKKWKELKDLTDRGKLGHKWTHERVDKESDEIINRKYTEYIQRKLNEKVGYTGKALGKHVINLCSTDIFRWLKIKDAKKLQQDIENDTIIKYQMASLGCLLVCTFGNLLVLVLVAVQYGEQFRLWR